MFYYMRGIFLINQGLKSRAEGKDEMETKTKVKIKQHCKKTCIDLKSKSENVKNPLRIVLPLLHLKHYCTKQSLCSERQMGSIFHHLLYT